MRNTPKEVYMVIVILPVTIGVFVLLFLGRTVPTEVLMIFGSVIAGFFGYAHPRTASEIRSYPTPEQEIRLIEAKTENNNSEPPVI